MHAITVSFISIAACFAVAIDAIGTALFLGAVAFFIINHA